VEMFKAQENDVEDAYNVIVECTHWLNKKGLKQWVNVYPKIRFAKDISDGDVYVFKKAENIFGTVTLYRNHPVYYPNDIYEHKDNVWYLSRFAISRNNEFRRLGYICMELIEKYALSKEIGYLRLDVTKSNPFLGKYYQEYSYRYVGEAEVFSERMVFMEKCIITNNSAQHPPSADEFYDGVLHTN
jgi:hypothetical protein